MTCNRNYRTHKKNYSYYDPIQRIQMYWQVILRILYYHTTCMHVYTYNIYTCTNFLLSNIVSRRVRTGFKFTFVSTKSVLSTLCCFVRLKYHTICPQLHLVLGSLCFENILVKNFYFFPWILSPHGSLLTFWVFYQENIFLL